MRDRPGVFDLPFLPGIVAGMMLAGVVLAAGNALFPNVFQSFTPQKTPLFVLASAILVASMTGFLSLALPSQGKEQDHQDSVPSRDSKNKDNYPSGGNNVL